MKKKRVSTANSVKENMACYYKTEGEIELPPKEYWEDSLWAHEHSTELSRKYPNRWVAVVNKRVVAHGKDGSRVRTQGKKTAGARGCPVLLFAEKGMHVYENFTAD